MALNYIWIAFFVIAYAVALIKLIFLGDTEIFTILVKSTFDMAKTAFEISLGLTGIMTLWLGLMKVGERSGFIKIIAKIIKPLFHKLFPQIPKDHPVFGSILMNISANMLGLDNAATPLGLKAMKQLQDLNPDKTTVSNSQIMFLVMNTSGLMLIPISIMMFRTQLGAAHPSDVFIPILLATFFSTLTGIIAVSLIQKINLFNKVVLVYLGGLTLIMVSVIIYFSQLTPEQISKISLVFSNVLLFSVIVGFLVYGFYKKIDVYGTFIEGAKDGFRTVILIIPYLVGILVSIAVFRASGAMDILISGLQKIIELFHINSDFIPALPTALMKPLSGSGARGLMVETMKNYGADSFVGKLSCIFQGSTDTTFYIIAVYFGSVGIKRTRYAITAGLIADFAGAIAAIFIAYIFFH